jgi:2-polyprenyl-3-methyl-5-hydroxy-6-metoxy-1,4-benzoquinol methylase
MNAVGAESQRYYDSLWASSKRLDQHHKCRLLAIEKSLRRLAWTKDRPRRILELGCGSGMIAQLLAQYGEVTGIDQSPVGIQTARSRVPGRFLVGMLPAIELEDGGFDLCVLSQVIEHFGGSDQAQLLRNVNEKVLPGGYVLVTTPNRTVASRIQLRPGEAQPIENWLDPSEVEDLLTSTGWRVLDTYFAFSFFPILASHYRLVRALRFFAYDILALRGLIERVAEKRRVGDCTVTLAVKV